MQSTKKRENKKTPNKIKIVTTSWDDGHKLDLKLAKLLKKYGVKGTFYIAPKNQEWGQKDLLSNNEIIQLGQDFEIGAHTMTHPSLIKISEKEAFQEIKDSKIFLEKLINQEVKMFCYPKGLYDKEIKRLVKKAGFIGARTIKPFRTSPPTDFFELGTTNHTVYRNINYSLRLALANNIRFIPFLFTKDWVKISCKIFDVVNQHGGIWHFWGHSWEIEEGNLWKELEEVLRYISGKEDFHYFSNGETLTHLKKGS